MSSHPGEPSRLQPGRTIGNLVVLGTLGRGGNGAVYRCQDPVGGQVVAVKVLLGAGPGAARLHREAGAAGRLRHPGIVPVLGIGEADGMPYLVMECVDGGTFADLLARGRMSTRRAVRFVRDVAVALEHAHARGIVHRDVKPQNVLIDATGRPRITDFGLASDVSAKTQLTATGELLGTPEYMAPEQADGDRSIQGPRTDVYGLGAMLYRAITGRGVVERGPVMAMIAAVLMQEPPSPRAVDPSIPEELDAIVMRCLRKEPAKRYATAGDLADELDLFLKAGPVSSRRTAAGLGPAARRSSALLAAGITAAVVVVLAIGAALGGGALGSAPPRPVGTASREEAPAAKEPAAGEGVSPEVATPPPPPEPDPNEAEAMGLLAEAREIARDRRRYREALKCVNRAIELLPDAPELYGYRAYLRGSVGKDRQGCLDDMLYAARLTPPGEEMDPRLHLGLWHAFKFNGRHDEAYVHLADWLRRTGGVDDDGDEDDREERLDWAVEHAQASLPGIVGDVEPDLARARLGAVSEHIGERHPSVALALGEAYRRLGDEERAAEIYRAVIDRLGERSAASRTAASRLEAMGR